MEIIVIHLLFQAAKAEKEALMRKLETTQKTLDETMIISGGGTKSFL